MIYLDASLVVSALANEPYSPKARAWIAVRTTEQMAISRWCLTEVSSALSLKLRTGEINAEQRAIFTGGFQRMVADSLTLLPISDANFVTAATFAQRHELSLRAGDALHLAVAFDHGATVHTLDGRMAAAGPALGVRAELVA